MIWKLNNTIDTKEMIGFSHHGLNGKQELHSHEFMEIEYVLKGSIVQVINDEVYEGKEGTFFVLYKEDKHWFYTNGPAEIINVDFYPELYNELLAQGGELSAKQRIESVVNVGKDRQKMEILLEFMEKEYMAKEEGYVYVLQNFLHILLSILLRYGKNTKSERDFDFEKQVHQYVNEHIEDIINVDDVAYACGLSRNIFFKKFRSKFGCTPLDYVNRQKIHVALRMLANEEKSVAYVMEKLNFYNKTHFYKLFLRYTGMYPSDVSKLKKVDMESFERK